MLRAADQATAATWALAIALFGAVGGAAARAPALHVTVQGNMLGADEQPLSGVWTMRFRIFAASYARWDQPETPLYEGPRLEVAFARGLFSVDLGPVPASVFDGRRAVYIEVSVDDQGLVPRLRWDAPLLARRAREATRIEASGHCDCVRVESGAGAACGAGRVLAGIYSECNEGGDECVHALHCCRSCGSR
jgi:hypothetical protein